MQHPSLDCSYVNTSLIKGLHVVLPSPNPRLAMSNEVGLFMFYVNVFTVSNSYVTLISINDVDDQGVLLTNNS